jgi:hypothetical protein
MENRKKVNSICIDQIKESHKILHSSFKKTLNSLKEEKVPLGKQIYMKNLQVIAHIPRDY